MATSALRTFRRFQDKFDFAVFSRIPETDLRVAIKLMRDASWIVDSSNIESGIRQAFRLTLDLLQPVTFWDVGANIGFYSWFVRRHPSVQRVVMFEPDPTNFTLIRRTIERNAIADCHTFQVALADRTGEAQFLVDHASGTTGSLVPSSPANTWSLHHAYQMDQSIACQTITIDDLLSRGEPAPDFIKIDVEGAEHLVLGGALKTLKTLKPALIIETTNEDLISGLRSAGYTAFRIDSGNLLFIAARPGLELSSLHAAFPVFA